MTAPFSFEFLVLLYVYSGLYKDVPLISGFLPFDPTMALAILLGVWLVLIVLARRTIVNLSQFRSLLFLLGLIAYCSITLFWTPSLNYAFEKMMYLLFISMLAFVSVFVIATDIVRMRRFLLANIAFAAMLAIALTVSILTNEVAQAAILANERFYIFGLVGVYQVMSRLFALALTAFLAGFWYFRATPSAWIVMFPLALLELFFILELGGRGGLLGLLVAGAVFGSYSMTRAFREGFRISLGRLILLSGAVTFCMVYAVYIFASGDLPVTLVRLFDAETLPNTYVYGYRAHLLMTAPELWGQSPIFGSGLGSYSILMGHGDIRDYPHNVVAEVLIELGLIGLAFYAMFLFWGWQSWWLERITVPAYLWLFSAAAGGFGLAMASVGNDLTGSRFIWMTYGLVFVSDGASTKVGQNENE